MCLTWGTGCRCISGSSTRPGPTADSGPASGRTWRNSASSGRSARRCTNRPGSSTDTSRGAGVSGPIPPPAVKSCCATGITPIIRAGSPGADLIERLHREHSERQGLLHARVPEMHEHCTGGRTASAVSLAMVARRRTLTAPHVQGPESEPGTDRAIGGRGAVPASLVVQKAGHEQQRATCPVVRSDVLGRPGALRAIMTAPSMGSPRT